MNVKDILVMDGGGDDDGPTDERGRAAAAGDAINNNNDDVKRCKRETRRRAEDDGPGRSVAGDDGRDDEVRNAADSSVRYFARDVARVFPSTTTTSFRARIRTRSGERTWRAAVEPINLLRRLDVRANRSFVPHVYITFCYRSISFFFFNA